MKLKKKKNHERKPTIYITVNYGREEEGRGRRREEGGKRDDLKEERQDQRQGRIGYRLTNFSITKAKLLPFTYLFTLHFSLHIFHYKDRTGASANWSDSHKP